MHTCIAYSSCIILTPYFSTIIDLSGSSCVWGWKGGRLVRTDSIICPINLLCLETTLVEQTEEMEQQQLEGNWTLEDVKGALMDDMKAMMQDELKQALAELMPPTTAIPPAVVAPVANPPVMDAPPSNNKNARGYLLNAVRNVPTIEIRYEDVENYMVEKAKKESLELAQDLESKQMKALTQKISKMEELMRG